MTHPSFTDLATRRWTAFVNVATVVWLVLFGLSYVPSDRFVPPWVDALTLGLLSVFVIDLGVTYYRAGLPPGAFLRKHWTAVLLVIPYFRIFRILRVGRGLRVLKLFRIQKATKTIRTTKSGLDHIKASKKIRRLVRR